MPANSGTTEADALDRDVLEPTLPVLQWYVTMRCVAASTVLLLFVLLKSQHATVYSLKVPISMCLLELALNGGYFLWTRRGTALLALAHLQFVVDIVAITCGVAYAGGLRSPLPALYNLVILSAGLVSMQFAAVHITLSCLMVFSLALLEPSPTVNGYPTGSFAIVHMVTFCLTAVLVSYYRVQIKKQQGSLQMTHGRLERAYGALQTLKTSMELANERLLHSLNTKSQFLSLVSHELRTPLNSVIGFADLLLDPHHHVEEEERHQFLEHILKSGKHLLTVIDTILEVARLDTADFSGNMQTIDLGTAVQDAVAAVSHLAEQRQLKLSCVLPEEKRLALVDPRRLRQALSNLLDNALRFTPPPGEITVRMAAEEETRSSRIEVINSGPGISKEHLQKIFEPFFQVEPSTRRHHDGAGLGLTVARAIIELQGGRMWAESDVGQATRVCFTLPVAAAEEHSG